MEEEKINQAARKYALGIWNNCRDFNSVKGYSRLDFLAGAYWHEHQNPWRLVEEELPPKLKDTDETEIVLVEKLNFGYNTACYNYIENAWYNIITGRLNCILRWKYIED
jgi:hypothetical protein